MGEQTSIASKARLVFDEQRVFMLNRSLIMWKRQSQLREKVMVCMRLWLLRCTRMMMVFVRNRWRRIQFGSKEIRFNHRTFRLLCTMTPRIVNGNWKDKEKNNRCVKCD